MHRVANQLSALAIIAAVCAGIGRSAPVAAAIFTADDRVADIRADARWRTVGLVSEAPDAPYGTAFLVGNCHALTARHIIHHAQPVGRSVDLRFEPWRRATAANSSAATVVAAGGLAQGPSDVSQDWVLLRLDQCLGRSLGFLPLNSAPLLIHAAGQGIGPDLIGVGYPNDQPRRGPTIDPLCRVRLITSFGLLHDCATLPGNSGGPLIGWNAARKRYEVYAINVAGFDRRTASPFVLDDANAAVAINSIRSQVDAAIAG